MLVAQTYNGIRKIASETKRSEGPFYCPYCKAEVGIRKGYKKIHHFYHIVDNPDCENKNESETHLKIKYEMYKHFITQPNCKNVQLERIMGNVISDINLLINGISVTIEIQNSNIKYEIIRQRMERYNKLGVYVIWVLADKNPSICRSKPTFLGITEFHNLRNWEEYIHEMFYGRLYYWQEKSTVKAVHFKKDRLYHDGGDEFASYSYDAKKRSEIHYCRGDLIIERDFIPYKGNQEEITLSYDDVEITESKIFIDNRGNWWENKN